MIDIDAEFIYKVAPKFSGRNAEEQAKIVAAIDNAFASTLDQYDINTPLRIAHFMGQVTHECAGFRTTVEFASGEAYEGRASLGNTQKGDGPRYKGRGLIQLTGRANYREMGRNLNIDLESWPEQAAEPRLALTIACEYWKSRKINAAADNDNLLKATKLVNGGTMGLEERGAYLKKAKAALAAIGAATIATQTGTTSQLLHRGSVGEEVSQLQELLRGKGYDIAIDGDFGPGTEVAVVAFQKSKGLTADGIVGPNTRAALAA